MHYRKPVFARIDQFRATANESSKYLLRIRRSEQQEVSLEQDMIVADGLQSEHVSPGFPTNPRMTKTCLDQFFHLGRGNTDRNRDTADLKNPPLSFPEDLKSGVDDLRCDTASVGRSGIRRVQQTLLAPEFDKVGQIPLHRAEAALPGKRDLLRYRIDAVSRREALPDPPPCCVHKHQFFPPDRIDHQG